jgi:HTH-type transcriptional regulator, sugar sensing transcriptional regulator
MELLKEIGLSNNEIKVYQALLDLDVSTTTKIVKKAQIPNSKIYPVLDKLITKGLVTYIIKNKVKHFQVADPNILTKILENKESKIKKQKKAVQKLIKTIKTRQTLEKEKQDATVYEGIKGIESIYEMILNDLNKGDEYYLINIPEAQEYKKWQAFFSNYHLKREEKGIKVKVICNTEVKSVTKKIFANKSLAKIKYIKEPMPSNTLIYKNKVITLLFSDKPTAIVVTSKQNADQYKKFFLNRWKQ